VFKCCFLALTRISADSATCEPLYTAEVQTPHFATPREWITGYYDPGRLQHADNQESKTPTYPVMCPFPLFVALYNRNQLMLDNQMTCTQPTAYSRHAIQHVMLIKGLIQSTSGPAWGQTFGLSLSLKGLASPQINRFELDLCSISPHSRSYTRGLSSG